MDARILQVLPKALTLLIFVNEEPKLVLMSRVVYENGLERGMEDSYINVKRDMELVVEPVLIRTFNNPAE